MKFLLWIAMPFFWLLKFLDRPAYFIYTQWKIFRAKKEFYLTGKQQHVVPYISKGIARLKIVNNTFISVHNAGAKKAGAQKLDVIALSKMAVYSTPAKLK